MRSFGLRVSYSVNGLTVTMSFEDDFVLPPRYTSRATARTDTGRISSTSTSQEDRSSAASRGAKPRASSGNPLLHTRVLSIAEYAEELLNGPMEQLSVDERIRLFGSDVVPIPVPLEPGEREATHEKRFRGWVAKRRLDLERQTVVTERKLRMDFAKMKTRMYDGGSLMRPARSAKRGRDDSYGDHDDAFESEENEEEHEEEEDDEEDEEETVYTKRQRTETGSFTHSSDLLLRKRVLSMDQYRAELASTQKQKLTTAERVALYGTPIAPVPVALFPGETVDDHERLFLASVSDDSTLPTRFRNKPNVERIARIGFARQRAMQAPPAQGDSVKRSGGSASILERVGGGARSVQLDVKSERASTTEFMEAEPTRSETPACSFVAPSSGSTTATLLRAFLACGCRECWLQCTHRLVDHLDANERAAAAPSAEPRSVSSATSPVMDITRDSEPYSQSSAKSVDVVKMVQLTSLMKNRRLRQPSSASTASTKPGLEAMARDDPIEQQLLAQYDEINLRVVENQHALATISTQLQDTPVDRVEVATSLQSNKHELEARLEEEMDDRNAALAMLAVYMWCNDKPDLTQRVQSAGTSNVPHVQRVCHQKCASITTELSRHRSQAAVLKRELDAVLLAESAGGDAERFATLQRVGEQLTHVEKSIAASSAARRREIATLIHFDAHVRELIDTLLQET
jgi:hypothetical protein